MYDGGNEGSDASCADFEGIPALQAALVVGGGAVTLLHCSCTLLVCAPAASCSNFLWTPSVAALVALAFATFRGHFAAEEARAGWQQATAFCEALRYWSAASTAFLGALLCRLFALFPRAGDADGSGSGAWLLLCSAATLGGAALLALAAWVAADGPDLMRKARHCYALGARSGLAHTWNRHCAPTAAQVSI